MYLDRGPGSVVADRVHDVAGLRKGFARRKPAPCCSERRRTEAAQAKATTREEMSACGGHSLQSGRRPSRWNEIAPPQVEHATTSQWADHGTLSPAIGGRPVLGADLNCSESFWPSPGRYPEDSMPASRDCSPIYVRFVPLGDICSAANCRLFDQLVGAGPQRWVMQPGHSIAQIPLLHDATRRATRVVGRGFSHQL